MRRMFAVEVGQPEETATRKRVSSAAMCITASPPTLVYSVQTKISIGWMKTVKL